MLKIIRFCGSDGKDQPVSLLPWQCCYNKYYHAGGNWVSQGVWWVCRQRLAGQCWRSHPCACPSCFCLAAFFSCFPPFALFSPILSCFQPLQDFLQGSLSPSSNSSHLFQHPVPWRAHSSSSSSGCCIMHRAQQKSQVNDGPPVVSHDMLESGRWCYFRLPSVKMMRSAVILLLSAGGISRAGGSLRLLTWTPKQQQWVPFLLSLLSPPIWKVMARDFQMFFIHYALMHAFI